MEERESRGPAKQDGSSQLATGSGPGIKLFESAAQPDIIRSAQKDAIYLRNFTDACNDAVRRLFGARRALLWARETRLLAELLYYGLTTGAGMQTLGEEYCDILQVTGAVGVEPGTAQRGLLVLLQSALPYLADRLTSAPHHSHLLGGSTPSSPRSFRSGTRPHFADDRPGIDLRDQDRPWQQRVREEWDLLVARGQNTLQMVSEKTRAAWKAVAPYADPAARLHLALFYYYGVYYSLSKRVSAVGYIFIGKILEQRPSYHVLGVLLFVQLAASGGSWALQQSAAASRRPARGPAEDDKATRPALVLREDKDEEAPAEEVESVNFGDVPPHRRCPLCLSNRDVPTATPCGHVFCWACIAEWHNQKAECPLCRAAFTTSGLVRVCHADF